MGLDLNISPGAYILAAASVILLPPPWWSGALMAALIHELAHMIAIWITGGCISGISIAPFVAKIETTPMTKGREAFCAAAGPLGSFILATLFPRFPEVAICAAAQGIFNLIPVFPLDGGRILKCLVRKEAYCAAETFTVILLLGVGLWCAVELNLGFPAMIPGLMASFRAMDIKIPCKESKLAVQ